jgi:hypothetical protein
MNRRAEILHELVRFEKPAGPLMRELQSFGWDWKEDAPLLVLKKEDLLRIIDRFLAHEISAEQLHEWAENLEVREDVAFDKEERDLIDSVFFCIAVPEINEPLTQESVRRMRAKLSSEKGDPADTENSGAAPRPI